MLCHFTTIKENLLSGMRDICSHVGCYSALRNQVLEGSASATETTRQPTSDDCTMSVCKHLAPLPQLQLTLRAHPSSRAPWWFSKGYDGLQFGLNFSTVLPCYKQFAKLQSLREQSSQDCPHFRHQRKFSGSRGTLTAGQLATNSGTPSHSMIFYNIQIKGTPSGSILP